MKPKDKNPNINQAAKDLIGKDRVKTITNDQCMFCDDPNLDFKDELSKKEYTISGICQTCQDKMFD